MGCSVGIDLGIMFDVSKVEFPSFPLQDIL